ncbi:MAG: DMT family transporter [Dysgonomonas sp.]|nr:DMT family transporter [Dysgonomonas sp.]
MSASHKYWYHLLAVFTIAVWGTTFVSTKVLIGYGLSPVEILLYRFVLAYIGIWFVCPKVLFAKSIKDELLCLAIGLCAGSLYFIFENTALKITLASNVALIICTSPIFTALLSVIIYRKEKLRSKVVFGSLIALIGVALVVFNGSFILQINPLGDILTILAALSWAFYGIILRHLNKSYSTLFLTRKVFFYGIVTMLPFFCLDSATFTPSLIKVPVIAANLVFLGIVASLLCYITWNSSVKELGVVQTSNYIYFIPLVTLFTSAMVLDEYITMIALLGSVLILFGVYVAEKGFRFSYKKASVNNID